MAARSPVEVGTIVAGKYRVERVIGKGGMGVVVAATHMTLGQEVALKFIDTRRESNDSEALERFVREARASVRLRSDHVAKVYDVDVLDSGEPYIVMELLLGKDLSEVRQVRGKLPPEEAVEYVLQACDALVEAHQQGIIHRDLKPQNLFITRRPSGVPLVKVLDFGISKVTGLAGAGELSITDTGAVLGSPLYMSPEQMRSSKNTDVRTDVWSLGVILFELLGGQLPFDGETVTELCLRVVQDPPASLATLSPELPQELVHVVMRCLEKERDMRFGSVADLAMALEPFSEKKRSGRERAWKSLADTARSQDFGAPAGTPRLAADASGASAAASGATEKASTNAAWDAPQLARTERRRGFMGGIAAGAAVAAVGLAVGLGLSGKLGGGASDPTGSFGSGPLFAPGEVTGPGPAASVPPVVSLDTLPVVAASASSPATPVGAANKILPGQRAKPGTTKLNAAGAQSPGTPGPSTSAATAPEPTPASQPTSSPNGAPILR